MSNTFHLPEFLTQCAGALEEARTTWATRAPTRDSVDFLTGDVDGQGAKDWAGDVWHVLRDGADTYFSVPSARAIRRNATTGTKFVRIVKLGDEKGQHVALDDLKGTVVRRWSSI